MTPEEIQAHAAVVKGNNYTIPPLLVPEQTPPVIAPPAPQVQSDMPPQPTGEPQQVEIVPPQPGKRVQATEAFGVGPPSVGSQDVINQAEQAADTQLQSAENVANARTTAAQGQAGVEKQIADAQLPIEMDNADLQGYLAKEQQAQQVEDDKNAKRHFDQLMTYNKEIEDHVANQPTDLWGRAGVNKIAGIIGLALGGLGAGGTGGKNLVVDTLNQLVDQNLKQNEYKYDMLKGKLAQENTAYAQIRATSQDKAQAAERYRLLTLNAYESQMKAAASQFAGPKAKANLDATLAQIQAERAATEQKIYEPIGQAYRSAGELALQKRGQDLQSVQLEQATRAATAKASAEEYLPGATLPEGKHVPPGEAQKLREQQGGAGQVQDTMSEMYHQALKGGVEAIINNETLKNDWKVAVIKQKDLSNRVSDAEAKTIEGMMSFLTTGSTGKLLTLTGAKTVPDAIRKAQQQFAQSWVTNLKDGHGFILDKDNRFLLASKGQFNDSSMTAPDDSSQGSATGAAPGLSSLHSRRELAEAAAVKRQEEERRDKEYLDKSRYRGYGAD